MSSSEQVQVSESDSDDDDIAFIHRSRGIFITDYGYHGTIHNYLVNGEETDDSDEATVAVGQFDEGPLKGKWVTIDLTQFEERKVTLQ